MAKVNYKIKKGIQIMIKEGPISLTKKIHCSIKKNNISILSMPFSEFKKTVFYDTVKYAPSIIIVDKGKVIKYLDANKDEDLEKYQDVDKFEKWLNENIYLKK